MWRRFSVFAGGAALAAAEQVCAGGPAVPADVLDLLTALVEKSLLTVRDGADGPRYLMLEIIRAYGQERNWPRPASRTPPGRRTPVTSGGWPPRRGTSCSRADQLTWLRRLAADQDNLHTAIRAAVAAGDADTAVGLAGDLGWYWWLRGLKAEGAELISDALTVADGAAPEPTAVTCTMGALLTMDDDDNHLAVQKFQRAAELAAQIPEPSNPVLRLVGPLAAVIHIAVGMPVDTVPGSPLDGVAADENPWMRSVARVIRGQLGLNFGYGHHEAEADFRAALATFREIGERWGTAFSLISVATLAMWRGDFTAAAADMQEALALASELGTTEDMVYFRLQLARCFWLIGDHDLARATMAEARAEAERIGLPSMLSLAALVAADQYRLDGDLAAAQEAVDTATGLLPQQKSSLQLRAMLDTAAGLIAVAAGDLRRAGTSSPRR